MTCTSKSDSSDVTVGRIRVAKWPDSGPTTSTLGWCRSTDFLKWMRVANGLNEVSRSVTSYCWASTHTESIRKCGRSCVARIVEMISLAAQAWLTPGLLRTDRGSPRRVRATAPDAESTGWPAHRLISYPA